MKICEKCGHRNFNIIESKGKRICEECGDKLSEYGSCNPIKGHIEYDNGWNGGYVCGPIKLSDDYEYDYDPYQYRSSKRHILLD